MGIVFALEFCYVLRLMKNGASSFIENERYRVELREKRNRVLKDLGTKFDTLAGMGRVAEDDQAQISHEDFISLQRNSLDFRQLRLINEALSRLDTDAFGACQACGEPIAAKRLRALPWARYCLTCQDAVGEELGREWDVPAPA
jgi:DnaK suppressor protein